jgi:hypothetical protein
MKHYLLTWYGMTDLRAALGVEDTQGPRPTVPRSPRRATQRIGLRPRLEGRPRSRPRARASRHRAGPAPLRPAARRLVTVAERRRRPRPDRCPGREQRLGPAHGLQPLHLRPRGSPQPAGQPRPRTVRGTWSVLVRGIASGYADRAMVTDAVRHASVDFLAGPPTARRRL